VADSSSTPSEPIDAGIVASATPRSDYDERGVPSLDYVRDKVAGRYATAMGDTELTEGSPEARSLDEQQAQREKAAKAKLDEIRRTLRG
jgi:phage shock protein A